MSTTAEQFAAALNDDGLIWTTGDGESFADLMARLGGEEVAWDGDETFRYEFEDGSSIVTSMGGWDLGLPGGCYCWAGVDKGRHAEGCDLSKATGGHPRSTT